MPAPHLTLDQFRQLGRRMVDFVADYMGLVCVWSVMSQDKPGDNLARLSEHLPKAAGLEFDFGEATVSRLVERVEAELAKLPE